MAEITRLLIANPFDRASRKRESLPAGNPLSSYLKDLDGNYLCCLNGELIPPAKRDGIILQPGDEIVVSPLIAGGEHGENKGILRMVAMMAVMVIATAISLGALGPVLGAAFAKGAIGAVLLGTGVAMGGSMLVSVLLAPPQLKQQENTQTYGWSGPVMLARQGSPIQKVYGKIRVAPVVLDSYTTVDGADQYLALLGSFGLGSVKSITDVEINDNPIANYQHVDTAIRLGNVSQPAMPRFGWSRSQRPQNVRLKTGAAATKIAGDRSDTQAIEIEFYCPKGLWAGPNADSSFDTWMVHGLVKVKRSGDPDTAFKPVPSTPGSLNDIPSNTQWVAISDRAPSANAAGGAKIVYATSSVVGAHYAGEPYSGTYGSGSIDGGQVKATGEWQPYVAPATTPATPFKTVPAGTWDATKSFSHLGNKQTAIRFTVLIDNLAPGKYDVQVSKVGASQDASHTIRTDTEDAARRGEELWCSSVTEIVKEAYQYPGLALLMVHAKATDQLSGAGLNVTAVVEGMYDNPADVAKDIMTSSNDQGGLGIPARLIDAAAWQVWHDYCNEMVDDGAGGQVKRAQFKGVFDSSGNGWDALRKICSMSYACIFRTGTHYTVAVDKAGTRSQLFTIGSIVQDSFSEDWLPMADRANSVPGALLNELNNWKQEPIVVQDDDAIQAGANFKQAATIDLFGVTHPGQAWHLMNRYLRHTKFVLRTVQLTCPVEAIAAQLGDVIGVQHSLPQWGQGGRILSPNDSTHITLDQPVTMEAGHFYNLIVQHPQLERYSGNYAATANWLEVSLDSSPTYANIKNLRFLTGSADYGIASVVNNLVTLNLDAGTGTTPPASGTCRLVEINVMETREVVNDGLGKEQIKLAVSSPFSQSPTEFANYTFGEMTREVKDFRLVGIEQTGELEFTLTGAEYDDRVYTALDPIVPPAPVGEEELIQVTNLEGHEGQPGQVLLSWTPGKYTMGANIYQQLYTKAAGSYPDSCHLNGWTNISGPYNLVAYDYYLLMTWQIGMEETLTGPAASLAEQFVYWTGDREKAAATFQFQPDSIPPDGATYYNMYIARVTRGAGIPSDQTQYHYQGHSVGTTTPNIATWFNTWNPNGKNPPTVSGSPIPGETLLGSVERQHHAMFYVQGGRSYNFRVVGFDYRKREAPHWDAPDVFLTIKENLLPSNVRNLRCTAFSAPNVTVHWEQVRDTDLAYEELRYSWVFEGAVWERGIYINRFAPTQQDRWWTAANGPGTYMVKAFDTAGQESAIAAMVVVRGAGDVRAAGTDPNADPVTRGPGNRNPNVHPKLHLD